MAGKIALHSFPVPVILSRIQFVGSPIFVLLVAFIAEMDLAYFFRVAILNVGGVLFELGSPFESEDAFFH